MEQTLLFAIVLLLALGAYWSLVIFPRQRDFQKRQQYVSQLQTGDEMITYGGIIGRVVSVEAEQGTAHVEIAPGVIVRVLSVALVQPFDPEKISESARKAQS
ncbi:MAG: preprotein translocase subunit YajC [Anaerolineae bacterium]|nr:preprotein translocase subunit YajC [Anaerolineae bacterium]